MGNSKEGKEAAAFHAFSRLEWTQSQEGMGLFLWRYYSGPQEELSWERSSTDIQFLLEEVVAFPEKSYRHTDSCSHVIFLPKQPDLLQKKKPEVQIHFPLDSRDSPGRNWTPVCGLKHLNLFFFFYPRTGQGTNWPESTSTYLWQMAPVSIGKNITRSKVSKLKLDKFILQIKYFFQIVRDCH